MNNSIHTLDEYRAQLRQIAQAMAVARNEAVLSDLAEGFRPFQVEMFTEGNLDKRLMKLQTQLELLAELFDDLDDLFAEYIRTVPLSAYDTGSSDAENFLLWLACRRRLTPEQQDAVACQQARHAVEELGRSNRMGHIRFQDLAGMAERLVGELGTNPELRIFLNPIRVETVFRTHWLLDEEATLPAEVVFYPVGCDIRTALLEPDGLRRFRELEQLSPCTLDEWSLRADGSDREELVEFCRDLAEIGLVAFG